MASRPALDPEATLVGRGQGPWSMSTRSMYGRYEVRSRAGAGATGIVYEAWDPELSRRIALKVIDPSGDHASRAAARAAVLREARALAHVDHPNVIDVYDIGVADDAVYLAMEFVAGRTMLAWSTEQPESRRILEVLDECGRALAAAHDAGLVHGDFKPANVLIPDEGPIKVVDFGLARAVGRSDVRSVESPEQAGSLGLTIRGRGTPAYMAPEQIAGDPSGPKSDQFAFCVTAWELLFGRRPFVGASLLELATAVLDGRIETPSRDQAVPRHIERALRRGLATDPGARHSSMRDLLAALAEDGRGGRWWWLGGAAALGGVVAWGTAEPTPECSTDDVQRIWSETRAAGVEAAFSGTELDYALDAAAEVRRRLDGWVADWSATYLDTCAGVTVAEDSDPNRHPDLACLHSALSRLDAVVTVLEAADSQVVRESTAVVGTLPEPSSCDDDPAPTGDTDQRKRDELRELERRLARVLALMRAGRLGEAEALADAAVGEARVLGNPKAEVDALLVAALVDTKLARHERGEQRKEAAFFLAQRHGFPRMEADAAQRLAFQAMAIRSDETSARGWLEHARVSLRRAGLDPEDNEELQRTTAEVDVRTGRYDEAVRGFEAVLRRRLARAAPDADVAAARHRVGIAYLSAGRSDEAVAELERALEGCRATAGRHHPRCAEILADLGIGRDLQGDGPGAVAAYESTLDLLDDHQANAELRARTMVNLAVALETLDRIDEAIAYQRSALGELQRMYGPEHPAVATAIHNLGHFSRADGRLDEAQTYVREALIQRERLQGPEHRDVARSLTTLGEIESRLGDHEAALSGLRRALDIAVNALEDEREAVAIRAALAEALLRAGDVPAAQREIEVALEELGKIDASPRLSLMVTRSAANIAWERGERQASRARMMQLAAAIEALISDRPDLREEIDEWLAEHPEP